VPERIASRNPEYTCRNRGSPLRVSGIANCI
jgi:hypothetical protein